jgi:hypothetical protein
MPVEFSLRGMDLPEIEVETRALRAIADGNLAQAQDILGILPDAPIPPRLKEAQWMLEAGYLPDFDHLSDGVVRWLRQ